jgi:hypothetical protein
VVTKLEKLYKFIHSEFTLVGTNPFANSRDEINLREKVLDGRFPAKIYRHATIPYLADYSNFLRDWDAGIHELAKRMQLHMANLGARAPD